MTDDDVNVEDELATAVLVRITAAVDYRAAALEIRAADLQRQLEGVVERLRRLDARVGRFFLPHDEGIVSWKAHHESGLSTQFTRRTYRRDEA